MIDISRGKIVKRTWRWQGHKRVAYLFDVAIDGRRVRKQYASKQEAKEALEAFREEAKQPPTIAAAPSISFAQAIEEYCKAKARKKSLAHDKLYLSELRAAFGAETPLDEITGAVIARWKNEKLSTTCPRTGRSYSAASINRPLAALRHLLQLAHEQQWAPLVSVPKIRLEPEPEGRIRWLEPDEEARLLAACAKSRNPELLTVVTIALETGLRRGELLGLTWDRIDLSRGVIRLEVTKSGKRREVPMRQAVYDVLAALPEPREGRVFRTRSIRTAFENAVEEARVDSLHFHDLRHHFASWFVMRGGTLPALQKLLGHADLKMTLRYAHLAPEYLRDEVTKTERSNGNGARTAHEVAVTTVHMEDAR
jgi:integrase